jgi:hypothetical protein
MVHAISGSSKHVQQWHKRWKCQHVTKYLMITSLRAFQISGKRIRSADLAVREIPKKHLATISSPCHAITSKWTGFTNAKISFSLLELIKIAIDGGVARPHL